MSTPLGRLRSGDWLHRARIIGYARVLLAVELVLFAVCVAGTHGLIVPLRHPTSTDFVSFYAAGQLADSPAPWLAYDHAAHHAAEQAATQPGIPYNYFYYPPVFLLLCGLLARLPYLTAFIAFQAATLALCLWAVRRILPGTPLTVVLAFPAVFWTLGTGQNAFLTAALFTGGTLLMQRRPVVAGLLFGALCYKPQFGLLLPVALAAGHHWRCFAAAACAAVALSALSVIAFGWGTWQAFLAAASASHSVYATRAVDLTGYTNPFGLLLTLGQPRLLAELAQLATIAGAAALVWTMWRRGADPALRAAVLLAATPVAAPVSLFYDLMLTGMAMAWLVRFGLRAGFGPWQKPALALLFVLPLLSGNLAHGSHLAIAPIAAALGLLLAATAAWRHLPAPVARRATAMPAGEPGSA